jgi:VWFA-related protein
MRRIASLIIVSIFLTLTAAAQLKETISVNVVEVPVTVVDSSGNPVRGLTAANFKLLDNGRERDIVSFDKIDFATASSAATAPMNPAARRNFLLLFDLSNSSPRSLAKAQESARQFVEKAAQPRDLVGVGTIDAEHGFRLVTAFTTDRELISSAIESPSNFKSADPLQLSNETKLATLDTSAGTENPSAGPMAGAAREGREAAAAESKERMAQITRANTEYVRAKVQRQVDYLGALAKTLRGVPGRKQIVLLSEGFDPSVVTGRDVRDTTASKTDNDAIMSGNVAQINNDERFGSTTAQSMVGQMAQFFRGSDVVLHAIDIQGVRVQNDVQSGSRINSNAGLALLADPTGGMVFQNSNDMTGNFDRMLRAQEVVYVLAFNAPSAKPGVFHNLTVKLVNVPGGGKVFSRAGYYEGGGESAAERQLSTAEIILNDIPQNEVRVAALAAGFPSGSANAQVPVILEVDGTDLMKDLKGNTASAEIYIYAFDADGTVRDRIYQKVNLDLKKVSDKLRGSGLKYYATLTLPPGSYAVKSLVRVPESDHKGFARTDIVVAKAGEKIALSPIFIDEQPKWLMVKGTSHASANAPYPFDLNGEQFIPAAAARVKSGESKRFAVFVINAAPADVTFDTTPKVKFLGAAKSGVSTALVMELEKVDPSVSKLDVTVNAKGGASAQKASVVLQ